MAEYPVILGVYSQRGDTEVGAGSTKTVREKLTYWYVRQIGDDRFEVQPLNVFHVPSGLKQVVTGDEFLEQYTPEPRYYQSNTVPAMSTLLEKISRGEEYFAQGKLDKAEQEFIKALMLDDVNVDANYGLGDVYTEKKEFDKLAKVLKVLMGSIEAFNVEHRQRLNSFGVRLRKNGCHDQSIEFFTKALELNPRDDHIYFNIARTYFDMKDIENCKKHLAKALEIDPTFAEAIQFTKYCDKIAAQTN